MSATIRILLGMTTFSLLIVCVCGLFYLPLSQAFMANPVLHGMVLGVFLLGVASNFRQVATLVGEQRWLQAQRQGQPAKTPRPPRLLEPIAKLLGETDGALSPASAQAQLDGIRVRLDEVRDLSRYLIGLMVLLGLLGTVWALLGTLDAVAQVIRAVDPDVSELGVLFQELRSGLQAPLRGVGNAFGSALLGLGGSLILGFLDLQTGAAQNRFTSALESWLAGLHQRRHSPGTETDTQRLLAESALQIERLGQMLGRGEEERRIHTRNLQSLAAQMATFTEQLRGERDLLLRLLPDAGEKRDGNAPQAPLDHHLQRIEELLLRLLRATRHSPDALALALQRELGPLMSGEQRDAAGTTMELPFRRRR